MMKDVECPYCGLSQDINHDDGYGYSEDVTHQQECNCGKTFTYTTSIIFCYEVEKAPCLNQEQDHDWKPTTTYPRAYTKMRCSWCDEERDLTDEERVDFKIPEKGML